VFINVESGQTTTLSQAKTKIKYIHDVCQEHVIPPPPADKHFKLEGVNDSIINGLFETLVGINSRCFSAF
jgi:hypothetical protein